MSDQPIISGRRFFTVAEIARMFGLSSMTIYRAIGAGEFPAIRVRGRSYSAVAAHLGGTFRATASA